MPKAKPMTAEEAATVALSALAFLAEDASRLSHFLKLSGLSIDDLRREAAEPHMQAAILEHLLGDESLLLVFAASRSLKPEAAGQAHALLGGSRSFA